MSSLYQVDKNYSSFVGVSRGMEEVLSLASSYFSLFFVFASLFQCILRHVTIFIFI